MDNILKEILFLELPSQLWGVHVDEESKVIGILHLNIMDVSHVNIDKAIMLAEENTKIIASIFLNNERIYLQNLDNKIKELLDISALLKELELMKSCLNMDTFSNCLKVTFNGSDYCSNCVDKSFGFTEVAPFNQEVKSCDQLEYCEQLLPVMDQISCRICYNSFCKEHLLQHLKKHITICKDCDTIFYSDEFDMHCKEHNISNYLRCINCEEQFINEDDFSIHKKSHQVKCSLCNELIFSPQILHNISCKYCDTIYYSENELQMHLETHKIICQVCDKEFYVQNELNEHIQNHFSCEICGNYYYSKLDLTNHFKQHNECADEPESSDKEIKKKMRKNLCPVCGKTFSCPLKQHLATHSPQKPHECLICNKTFLKRYNLKVHQNSHSGKRPFSCSDCLKTYTSRSNLLTHIKSAHKKKEFMCDVCNMTFVYPRYLKIHQRKHTGERPYACVTCGKGFAKKINLTVHSRLHSGEKPFVCTHCGKAFITNGNLSSHIKARHTLV